MFWLSSSISMSKSWQNPYLKKCHKKMSRCYTRGALLWGKREIELVFGHHNRSFKLDRAAPFSLEVHPGISARCSCEQELWNNLQRHRSNCRESSGLEKRVEIKTQILESDPYTVKWLQSKWLSDVLFTLNEPGDPDWETLKYGF